MIQTDKYGQMIQPLKGEFIIKECKRPLVYSENWEERYCNFKLDRDKAFEQIVSDVKAGTLKGCYTFGNLETYVGVISNPAHLEKIANGEKIDFALILHYNWND